MIDKEIIERMVEMYEVEMKSAMTISVALGIPISAIFKGLRDAGVKIRTKYNAKQKEIKVSFTKINKYDDILLRDVNEGRSYKDYLATQSKR